MLWRVTHNRRVRGKQTQCSDSNKMATCEFSGGFSGEKRNGVWVECYETKTFSVRNGISINVKNHEGSLDSFQFVSVVLSCLPPPLHTHDKPLTHLSYSKE